MSTDLAPARARIRRAERRIRTHIHDLREQPFVDAAVLDREKAFDGRASQACEHVVWLRCHVGHQDALRSRVGAQLLPQLRLPQVLAEAEGIEVRPQYESLKIAAAGDDRPITGIAIRIVDRHWFEVVLAELALALDENLKLVAGVEVREQLVARRLFDQEHLRCAGFLLRERAAPRLTRVSENGGIVLVRSIGPRIHAREGENHGCWLL